MELLHKNQDTINYFKNRTYALYIYRYGVGVKKSYKPFFKTSERGEFWVLLGLRNEKIEKNMSKHVRK